MSQDSSKPVTFTAADGKKYLDRERFDFNKHKQIKNDLVWRASSFVFFILISLFMTGYSSYYINEYKEKKNYESWIYYILIIFLAFSLINIVLISLFFSIIPYAKIRGILLLVKSMTNIYGADYADPEIHTSMGSILGKSEKEGSEIATYLQQYHGNVPSQIIRSFNPDAYKGLSSSYPQQPIQNVTNADGNKVDVTAPPVAKPGPSRGLAAITRSPPVAKPRKLQPLAEIDVDEGGSSPAISARFPITQPAAPPRNYALNPVFDPTYSPGDKPFISTIQRSTTPEITQEDYDIPSVFYNDLQDRRDAGEAAANANQPTNQPTNQKRVRMK